MTVSGLIIYGAGAISSAPFFADGIDITTATLKSGDTIYSFVAESTVTLRRLLLRNKSAGVGGTGDTVSCNNCSGPVTSTMSVTLPAAAARMTRQFSPSPWSGVPAGTEICCHYEGSSSPKPEMAMTLEWVLQ